MRLDATGNLGLGATPSAWHSAYRAIEFPTYGAIYEDPSEGGITISANSYGSAIGVYRYKASYYATQYRQGAGNHYWYTAPSGTAGNPISFTQAMTLNASGQLIVGGSTGSYGARVVLSNPSGYTLESVRTGTALEYHFAFSNANFAVGTISTTGTATAYNTASDYRLKNITGPVTDSGSYIDSLKPVQGSWKTDGSPFVGFLAHEVQEVSRTPITTGEKDGEGMQAMDYSSAELIANMVAELKSLRARIAQLESKA